MIGAKASTGRARLATIANAALMVFAVVLIHVPDADARPRGGGASGARSGGGGSVRHSSVSRRSGNRTRLDRGGARIQPSRGGAGPGKSTRPGKGATPGRGAKPGKGVSPGRGAARSRHASARYSARKDARREWRRWRRNRALFAVGVAVLTRPRYSTTVVVTGTTYYYWGGVYYVSSGSKYVVVAPPPKAVVYAVPTYTTIVYAGSTPYYYAGGTYYVATSKPAARPEIPDDVVLVESEENPPMTEDDHNYMVVEAPVGSTVPYLPDESEEKRYDGKTYFIYEGTYYRPFVSDGETIYQVAEAPAAGG